MVNKDNRKRTWKKWLFSLIAVVLFFAAVEGALRFSERNEKPALPPSPIKMQHIPAVGIIARPAGSNHMSIMMDFSDRVSVLPYPKPKNTFRIYVFGGSAAAGLGFPHNGHFGRWLGRMLEQACPDRDIEIVKMASVGFSSVQVLTLVDEVLEEGEPDLLVVYAGNNEYLDVKANKAMARVRPLHGRRIKIGKAGKFAIVRFLKNHLPKRQTPEPKPEAMDAEIQKILESYIEIGIDDDENRLVLQRYRANLNEIAEKAASQKVPVVLCTLIANPIHDLESYFFSKLRIGDESLYQIIPQIYGWARLKRWDRAEPLLEKLAHLGPGLDLFRMYEAGGIRGIPRLSNETRMWLIERAKTIASQFESAETIEKESRLALAICYRLLGQEGKLKRLMDKEVDFTRPEEDPGILMKRAYWAQFLSEEQWKRTYEDLWQNECRGNIACPEINEVVREVAKRKNVILADVEWELADWLDPGPLRYLNDYCHFNLEGAFEVANLVYQKALAAGALPGEAKAINFRDTLLEPDLTYLRKTGHDFLERDKWMGFDFRVCFVYCKPPAGYHLFDQWAKEDGGRYPDKEVVNAFAKHRRWFQARP